MNTTKIKVIGVGGSGSNAVSRMMKYSLLGVELIAINTDTQDLIKSKAHQKIIIGENITYGLGTGMKPNIAQKAAEESIDILKKTFQGTHLAFIACGLGGGTGTGASPVIAEILKEMGVLTVAVVTMPFSFEGKRREDVAKKGLKELSEKVDALIVVSNDKLFKVITPEDNIDSAFWMCDEILRQAVQSISDTIIFSGLINIDFADVKTILKESGPSFFGIGLGKGENRAKEAVYSALKSPLVSVSSKKAKGVIFNISGGEDINLSEIDEIAKIIRGYVLPNAKIIFGVTQDKKLKKGEIKVTIVATGLQL